ncbi:MAG TPA: hypothetical protein VGQ95_02900 [Chthoniobacterales bacterium]|nr:hypothetical protein [Chthoniobacterales bacterium]
MNPKPIWPILLAGFAFLYLWWLAALVFDLVFTWRRYIRRSTAINYLRNLRTKLKKNQHDNEG